MIHDLFFRRYPQMIYGADRPTPAMHQLFVQAAHIVFVDLHEKLKLDAAFFQKVHDALARELGLGLLSNAQSYDAMCGEFLVERYDLWNDGHGSADTFLKRRLSIVELLFRTAEERVATFQPTASSGPSFFRRTSDTSFVEAAASAMADAVRELNNRFRQAGVPLHFHNGLIQFAQDDLTEDRNTGPCWTLLRDAKWSNADRELKEAFDRSDNGRADAAFYSAKALESVIKIISDERGWTTGSERGAANYIDNLVSQRNGRFILPWEAELLKAFFAHVRNPHGHGAGSQPPPDLADYQMKWAIETAMSWIKSLIRRL